MAQLLKPSITLWVSALHTHAAQFDRLVSAGSFASVEEAIAHEYGELVAAAKDLVIVNADNPLMVAQTSRTSAQVQMVTIKDLKKYHASAAGSYFSFGGKEHTVPALLPKNNYYQLAMTEMLLAYLGKKPAPYSGFTMPPGRSNVFQGIRGSTLIDSTYNNANLDSLSDVVAMFNDYQAPAKWLVIGDILEQGQHEAREHARLAEMLNNAHFDRLLLIGPRVKRYTMPKLSAAVQKRTTVFLMPWDVLQYLQQNLPADPPATVLFKGVRFLEGVIEALLANPADAANLPRREPIWHKRRKQWGL